MKKNNSSRLTRFGGVLLMGSALLFAGCDTDALLEVTDTDTVNPGTLEDPDLIDIVVNGAIAEFTSGYSGGESFITVTALMSDEFYAAGTFPTRNATDQRDQQSIANGNTSDGTYVQLQQARRALREAAISGADGVATNDQLARVKSLEGYTYVALAEAYCAVPISNRNLESGEFEYSGAQTPAQLLTAAQGIFNEAITFGGPYADLARVGLGRALVNAGDYAGAAAAVGAVADDFVYFVEHSINAQTSGMWNLTWNQGRYGISDNEGINGLPFRSSGDMRIQFTEIIAGGFDPNFDLYPPNKYDAEGRGTVLASGVEARLIEAEAELAASDFAGMTAILNDLRANAETLLSGMIAGYDADGATLAPLAVPADAAAARDQLFTERAYWLFGTGHRMGDLRRLVRNYGLPVDQVYPTGAWFKGPNYGADVVFPVDFDETNNPEYELSECSVTTI